MNRRELVVGATAVASLSVIPPALSKTNPSRGISHEEYQAKLFNVLGAAQLRWEDLYEALNAQLKIDKKAGVISSYVVIPLDSRGVWALFTFPSDTASGDLIGQIVGNELSIRGNKL